MNSKQMARVAAGMMAVVVGATGCSTNTSGVSGQGSVAMGPAGTMAQMNNLMIVNNPQLAHMVQIVDMKFEYAGDLLKGTVTLVSKRSSTIRAQYKFTWYNEQGTEEAIDGSPWSPVVFYGYESKMIQAVAPNNRCRTFKINIREQE